MLTATITNVIVIYLVVFVPLHIVRWLSIRLIVDYVDSTGQTPGRGRVTFTVVLGILALIWVLRNMGVSLAVVAETLQAQLTIGTAIDGLINVVVFVALIRYLILFMTATWRGVTALLSGPEREAEA